MSPRKWWTAIAGTLLLLYIGNPFAKPDVTVDGAFGSGFPSRDVSPIVTVYNAGGATAKNCHVEVKDTQTQEGFRGTTVFSVSPDQKHLERLEFQTPKMPAGQKWDRRVYRIRAVCDNDVSPDSYTNWAVY